MATQLFLLDTVPDTHLGTNNNNLIPTAVGWNGRALGTARGSGVVNSTSTATVTGATLGVVVQVGAVAAEWISPPVSADVTISGTITLNVWARESANAANAAINVQVEVIRANALGTANSNTIVVIGKSARVTELGASASVNAVNNFTMTPTSTAVNRGDRLRVLVFADDAGTMASGQTFTVGYNGTTAAANGDTYVSLTENFSFESAPGGSVLYLTDTTSDVTVDTRNDTAWTTRGNLAVQTSEPTAAGWTAPIQIGNPTSWWTPQLTAFTLTGMAVANLMLWDTTASNDSVRCEIARVDSDGTNPTVWASWCIAPTGTNNGGLDAAETARTANVSGDDLAFTDGQRIRIRLYSDDKSSAAMTAGGTTRVRYDGPTPAASGDSYITLPQSVSEYVAATAGSAMQTMRQRRASRYLTHR